MSNKKKTTTKTKSSQSRSNKPSVEKMKAEIANELGVKLGPNATARENGSVGGEITKRLVAQSLSKKTKN